MGWTTFHKEKHLSVKDWFKAEVAKEVEVLDVAIVKFRTLYAACRKKDTTDVWAAIFLLDYMNADYDNFGYKDMDETCGPTQSECPERILKLLTPTDSQWANEWRERCWAHIHQKKARPKVKSGDTMQFAQPLHFTNGFEGDSFRYERYRNRDIFYSPGGGSYRIRNWRSMDYKVIAKETH